MYYYYYYYYSKQATEHSINLLKHKFQSTARCFYKVKTTVSWSHIASIQIKYQRFDLALFHKKSLLTTDGRPPAGELDSCSCTCMDIGGDCCTHTVLTFLTVTAVIHAVL